jgi:hypothetical protein
VVTIGPINRLPKLLIEVYRFNNSVVLTTYSRNPILRPDYGYHEMLGWANRRPSLPDLETPSNSAKTSGKD